MDPACVVGEPQRRSGIERDVRCAWGQGPACVSFRLPELVGHKPGNWRMTPYTFTWSRFHVEMENAHGISASFSSVLSLPMPGDGAQGGQEACLRSYGQYWQSRDEIRFPASQLRAPPTPPCPHPHTMSSALRYHCLNNNCLFFED